MTQKSSVPSEGSPQSNLMMAQQLRPLVRSLEGIWRGTLTNKPNGWRIKHPDEGPIEGEDLLPVRFDEERILSAYPAETRRS